MAPFALFVGMAVGLLLMGRMIVPVGPMIAGMFMPMIVVCSIVGMRVPVLVVVFMGVGMFVFVTVLLAIVLVLMFVHMLVLMLVPMFVSMVTFHFSSSFPYKYVKEKKGDSSRFSSPFHLL